MSAGHQPRTEGRVSDLGQLPPARFMPLGHFAKPAGSSSDQGFGSDGIVLLDGSQEWDIIGQSGLDFASASSTSASSHRRPGRVRSHGRAAMHVGESNESRSSS
jgi:hypothetical protein